MTILLNFYWNLLKNLETIIKTSIEIYCNLYSLAKVLSRVGIEEVDRSKWPKVSFLN